MKKSQRVNLDLCSSPKLYEILPEDSNGLDCLSASMVLSQFLDKKGIDYSFISPVGHISLMVKIEKKIIMLIQEIIK